MGALRKRWDIGATVILLLLALVAEHMELLPALEEQTVAFRHLARVEGHTVPFPEDVITFVNQDERFFDAYGSWPLRREDLARATENISKLGARVIAVDNLFDFPSSYGEDGPAAARFALADNVLVVSQGRVENGVMESINYPVPEIRAVTRSGYTNIESVSSLVEIMSRLRIFPEAAAFEDGWPFSVQAVAMYLGEEPSYEDGVLYFGDSLAVPFGPTDELHIDFPAFPAGAHNYAEEYGLSVLDFLDLESKTPAELDELRFWVEGRIVLFGDISEVSHDYFETPVGRIFGVEFIAATVSTLLAGGALQPAGLFLEVLLALLVMAGLVGTALMQRPGLRSAAALGILLAWGTIAFWLYVSFGVIVGMAYVLLAGFLSFLAINARFYLAERGQKALIRDAFGQYLSPKVVNILVKDPTRLSLGGELREMTAFFSDVAGFSSISEQLTPEELVALLNDYLTAMCEIIADYEGTVDKFEGDAIMAFWGAPLSQPDHARLACFAAIDMQKSMDAYRERLREEGRPVLSVRMGLNTGQMLVGNMGSAQRMDYTVMGDAVNLASRLEGANKFYATYSMISEFTYAHVADDVEVRELDLIRVVGKSEAVRVYELLERRGQLDAHMQEVVQRYNAGLALYKERRFEEAMEAFRRVLEVAPDDGPALTYIDRCDSYLQTPPPDDWDGVHQLTAKG
ncbi:MAG TPA: adenylate/guanylate cyclase domain-containing protein [Pseudomonadales bacterium]|nr:adenylate/guanylate cyclase domain-containing protein [Pseudomonadales bacterium]